MSYVNQISDPLRSDVAPPVSTIAVIAGSHAHREALVLALRAISGFQVVDVGWGTNDDFERLARLGPRLVLLDLEPVPVATIVRDIAGILPEIGIIALNQDDDPERAIPLIESGIAGLTLRSASLAEVVESIHAVLRGEFQCPPVIAAALVRHAREHAPGRAGAGKNELTPRERQVLALLEHGHSQKEVATLLSISPSTVRVHVHSALKKISGRAQGGGQGDGTEVQRPGLAP